MPAAAEFVAVVEPLTLRIEEFALASVEEEWEAGVDASLQRAGDLITLSHEPRTGRSIKFAVGAPALLAWRLVVLMGAKSVTEEAFGILYKIVRDPIEVERSNERYTHRSFVEERDLFYPQAFLGYADLPIHYLGGLWAADVHLHAFFETEDDCQFAIGQFLMIVALADAAAGNHERPLYPRYRLLHQGAARRAMSQLCSRLARIEEYRNGIARVVMNGDGSVLQQSWSELVERANKPELGSRYFTGHGVNFPDTMESQVEDW